MKHILWIVHPSMRSYKTNKYLLSSDGPTRKVINIVNEVLAKYNEYKFTIVLPSLKQVDELKDYYELFYKRPSNDNLVQFLGLDYPHNALLSRFNFDIQQIETILGQIIDNVDLIINDISELTLNYKVWLKIFNHKDIPIISTTGHFSRLKDNKGYGMDYFLRQIDGYLNSKKLVINKRDNLLMFKDTIQELEEIALIPSFEGKFLLWDYCFSSKELATQFTNEKFDKTTVFFISRLSDESRTKAKAFIDYINELYKKVDFQVIFANVNEAMDWDYLINNITPLYIVKNSRLTREEYVKLLWKVDIVPILYDTSKIFSMGEYEAMYTHNIIINKLEDLEKAIKLNKDNNKYKKLDQQQWEIVKHSVEHNVDNFIKDIEIVCS